MYILYKTRKTGGYNAYANQMSLRVYNPSGTIVGTISDCEIKPWTNDTGQAFEPWYDSCSVSFPAPSSGQTYTYRAIVNNNGCVLNNVYKNFGWGNGNEMSGSISF